MEFKFLILSILIVSNADLSYQNFISTPVAVTKSGEIIGAVKTLANGNKINEYLGIPYAQPPTGELRFKKPVPVTSWKKTLQAVKETNSCMQLIVRRFKHYPVVSNISEDCLFLNIWTPNGKPVVEEQQKAKKLLPVMFWIHGGALLEGSIFTEDLYNASYIASLGDVIVVTTNYRLGVFGFLYSGNDEMPGNMGFHDQLLALKWVKENIVAFGGDSNLITIFGESAGSWSVSAMVLSPLAKGLFKRAILQSGATNVATASQPKEKSMNLTLSYAKSLNCTGSTVEMVKCLRSKSAQDLVKFPIDYATNAPALYGDQYLPLKPAQALKQGKLNQVDLLFGHVKNEGSIFTMPLINDINILNIDYVKTMINQIFLHSNLTFGKKAADFYVNGLKNEDKVGLVQALSACLGDYFLTCPTVLFGSKSAAWNKNNTVYAYTLAEAPANSFFEKGEKSEIWRGVVHAEDVIYLFGKPLRDGQEWPEKDKELSRNFIKAWTTFAKTGQVPSIGLKSWNQAIDRSVINPHVKYMELSRQSKMFEHGYDKTCEGFWKQFIEE